MFERLTREEGYGVVESLFAVMSWMGDAIDDAADAADAEIQQSTAAERSASRDASEGASFDDPDASSREPSARQGRDDEPDGVFSALSSALREWFAIDIREMDARAQRSHRQRAPSRPSSSSSLSYPRTSAASS